MYYKIKKDIADIIIDERAPHYCEILDTLCNLRVVIIHSWNTSPYVASQPLQEMILHNLKYNKEAYFEEVTREQVLEGLGIRELRLS